MKPVKKKKKPMSLMNLMTRVLGFEAQPEKPLISLVMLLDKPRSLDDDSLRRAANSAWSRHYGKVEEGSLVVGEAPSFVITSRNRSFVITEHAGSFSKDARRAGRFLMAGAVRQAFLDHSAWISVDLLRPQNPEGRDFVDCMGMLGKLTSELITADCLLLVSPHSNQACLCDQAAKDKLDSDNPFDAFREAHAQLAPVAATSPASPASPASPVSPAPASPAPTSSAAASLEAQRRWPEFLDAFQHRQAGQLFSVKAMVSDGRSKERVWIRVYNIYGEDIAGLIDSPPEHLTALKKGDRVSASSSDISDWMFVKHGTLVGGFSERALAGQPHA